MLINILLVGLGSMFGGIARYLLSGWVKQLFPGMFPFGTFTVNLIGCFIIGFLSGLIPSSSQFTAHHRLLFAVGFCGSFTTFSTFSLDNLELLTAKAYLLFSFNILLSIFLGLTATWGGYLLGKK